MTKFWHSLGTIGLVVLTAVIPSVQHTISTHPVVITVLGGIWAIIGHLLPSPVVSQG
jgi:hypothetical protein